MSQRDVICGLTSVLVGIGLWGIHGGWILSLRTFAQCLYKAPARLLILKVGLLPRLLRPQVIAVEAISWKSAARNSRCEVHEAAVPPLGSSCKLVTGNVNHLDRKWHASQRQLHTHTHTGQSNRTTQEAGVVACMVSA
eukprot:4555633-Amphidinium_carterae.1